MKIQGYNYHYLVVVGNRQFLQTYNQIGFYILKVFTEMPLFYN